MSLLRNTRTSPRATSAPALLRAAQLKGRGSVRTRTPGLSARCSTRVRVSGSEEPLSMSTSSDARVRAGGGSQGVDAGAEQPWLVAEGNQDADREVGRDRPHNAGDRSGAGVDPSIVPATAEGLLDVAGRCGADVMQVFGPVAQHLRDVGHLLGDFSGSQRALVLECRRVAGHETGQAIGHAGPHGERAAHVGAREEELGREVGFEPRRTPSPVGAHQIFVPVHHAHGRERGGEQEGGVGGPDVTREEECPSEAPARLEADPEELAFRARPSGPEDADAPPVPQRHRTLHETTDLGQPLVGRHDGERPAAALSANALERAPDGGRLGVGHGHDQAQIRSPGRRPPSASAAPRGGAPSPRRVQDPARRREGGAVAPEGRRAPVPRRQSTGPAPGSRVGAGERGPVTIRRWGYATASSWGRDLRIRTRK